MTVRPSQHRALISEGDGRAIALTEVAALFIVVSRQSATPAGGHDQIFPAISVQIIPTQARSQPAQAAAQDAAPPAPQQAKAPPAPVAPVSTGNGKGRMLSPVVRRLAADNNLDLASISGTGGGGRVMREDVLAAIAAGPTRPAGKPAPQTTAAPTAGEREEVLPLSRIRIVTAERMVESRRTSAHVWTSIEVDLEKIEQVRQKHKAAFRKAAHERIRLSDLVVRERAFGNNRQCRSCQGSAPSSGGTTEGAAAARTRQRSILGRGHA